MDTSNNNSDDSKSQPLVQGGVRTKLHFQWQRFKESSEMKCTWGFIIKATFISVLGTFLILNGIYGLVMPRCPDMDCLEDKIMTLTNSVNAFFEYNPSCKYGLIILSSLCVDVVVIMTAVHWMLFAKSWRLMFTILSFAVMKWTLQNGFHLAFPKGYIWEYPGFPSLLVNYNKVNNFFFSSIVGILVICALEWRKNEFDFLMVVSFAVSLMESVTVLIMRTNYIIDVVCAYVFAHYLYMIIDNVCSKYIDKSCISFAKTETTNVVAVQKGAFKGLMDNSIEGDIENNLSELK